MPCWFTISVTIPSENWKQTVRTPWKSPTMHWRFGMSSHPSMMRTKPDLFWESSHECMKDWLRQQHPFAMAWLHWQIRRSLRLIRLLDTQSRMRMVMKSGSISFQFIGTETVYSDFPLKNSQNLTANGVCGEIINFVRIQRTSCMLWHRMPFLLSRKTTEQRL